MQKLYAAAARESDFLHTSLGGSAGCAWCAEELAVFRRVEAAARAKPLLLLPRWPADDGASPSRRKTISEIESSEGGGGTRGGGAPG